MTYSDFTLKKVKVVNNKLMLRSRCDLRIANSPPGRGIAETLRTLSDK